MHEEILILCFLKKFKSLMTNGGLFVIPRRENLEALAELGLTKKDREQIILSLTPQNFCKGPEADLDPSAGGYVWIFGHSYSGIEIYIKIKIDENVNPNLAKCISFHRATSPMCYKGI